MTGQKNRLVLVVFGFCYFMLMFYGPVVAMPALRLPFSGGISLYLTRGYNTETHKDYGGDLTDDRYALDFVGSGCTSWNQPTVAVANGVVYIVHDINDNGYGKYVILSHGNGYYSRYAHLNSVSVQKGQYIVQGQEIGKIGNTGNVSGASCAEHPGTHLHFALYHNGEAAKPEPMSGYTNFTVGKYYRSDNYFSAGTTFTLPSHSSQGWTPGRDTENCDQTQSDTNTWMVTARDVDGDSIVNPGVESPNFAPGINTHQFRTLKFSARVDGSGGSSSGQVWLKTPDNNWNYGIDIGPVPRDYSY